MTTLRTSIIEQYERAESEYADAWKQADREKAETGKISAKTRRQLARVADELIALEAMI